MFWRSYPALLYGLCCLLGSYMALNPTLWLLLPLALLASSLISVPKRLLLALLLFLLICINIHLKIQIPFQCASGTAFFQVDSLAERHHNFGKQWVYKGTLKKFVPDNATTCSAKVIPCSIILPDSPEIRRPLADRAYLLHGTLKALDRGGYLLKVSQHDPWKPIPNSFSLAEIRYQAKKALSGYIHAHVEETRSAVFLSGIITGDFDDRLMQHEFGRFGLQHLMAISGFHFAIIAAIFNFILRIFFSRRAATYILIAILSTYFLFLGCNPSIIRSWIAVMAGLLGLLLERHGSGLNALGVGLMAILLYDPLLCQHIGFQFSFAATAALLMLFPASEMLLQRFCPKRPLSVGVRMDIFNQLGLILLTLLRQGVALGIAVNLVTLPLMLYHFHRFPLMSLLYNLFFPLLVSFSMLLLIVALLLGLIFPPLADLMHRFNCRFTHGMLDFTYNIPPAIDWVLRLQDFPIEVVIVSLSLIFWLALKKNE